MEVKFGPMALQTAMQFLVRSDPKFASTTSKRSQAPETTRFIYFQACFRFASATAAVEASGDTQSAMIDGHAHERASKKNGEV